ncbi:methyltransferase domain-containing protein [Halostella sp. JP-L12]|uniref:class I SAM-dependent methyltransferase n=1 Tax=Halostella TaxID=1843185 RepID=UPI000EF7E91A|nr:MULTISPECIES: methyltransferase domain-containing protein [Halostella]NHN47552.1 methyltransferase domain-containing protein [Halostella sp. JP-L12]
MASAQSFYGRWAGLYDRIALHTPGVASLRERAAAALRLSPGDTVVDMGCGTGANLPYLRERVGPEGTVVGVDFTGPILDRARRLVDRRGWENVHVVRGDATRPPVAGGVDGVLSTFVVGMFADPAGTVDDWCDLVRPGGHVVLLNAARSDRSYAAPINAAFRAVTVLSTPPTLTLRYDDPPDVHLTDRVRAARDALRARSDAVAHEEHWFGIIRLSGGRIA